MDREKLAILGIGRHVRKNIFLDIQTLEKEIDIVLVHYNDILKKDDDDKEVITYLDLLEREDLIMVYNCLPNSLHYQTTKELLGRNKHVLCEKPITLSLLDIKDLIHISLEKEVVLREAFMYRYHKQIKSITNSVDKLGELSSIDVQFHYNLEDTSNIRLKKEMGGGIFYDVGCYCVDFLRLLGYKDFDKIISFKRDHLSQGVDSYFLALLFQKKVRLTFEISLESHREQFILIKGEKGKVEIYNPFLTKKGEKTKIIVKYYNKPQELYKFYSNQVYHDQLKFFIEEVKKGNIEKNKIQKDNVEIMEKIWKESKNLV